MSNICPSCKKDGYGTFNSGSYFTFSGSHCRQCGYYKAQKDGDNIEGFAVLVECEKCKEEQWIPDFPRATNIMSEGRPHNIPAWQCLSCDHYNNILTTIKKK